jgi:hypothetical protein
MRRLLSPVTAFAAEEQDGGQPPWDEARGICPTGSALTQTEAARIDDDAIVSPAKSGNIRGPDGARSVPAARR